MHLRELSGPNCISHLELCQIVLQSIRPPKNIIHRLISGQKSQGNGVANQQTPTRLTTVPWAARWHIATSNSQRKQQRQFHICPIFANVGGSLRKWVFVKRRFPIQFQNGRSHARTFATFQSALQKHYSASRGLLCAARVHLSGPWVEEQVQQHSDQSREGQRSYLILVRPSQ